MNECVNYKKVIEYVTMFQEVKSLSYDQLHNKFGKFCGCVYVCLPVSLCVFLQHPWH